MKITVVTVCYNSEDFIYECIESVLSQSYPNIEYIVVDGGSSDSTLEILRQFGSRIACVVSEPDDGIYHAMNKGLGLASGDYVCFLNSDDSFAGTQVIAKAARAILSRNVDICYGDIVYIPRHSCGALGVRWKTGNVTKLSLFFGRVPPHPAFLASTSLLVSVGGFSSRFSIAADYDLMIASLLGSGFSACYLPLPFVRMRLGGASRQNLRNIVKGNIEVSSSVASRLGCLAIFPVIACRFLMRFRYLAESYLPAFFPVHSACAAGSEDVIES